MRPKQKNFNCQVKGCTRTGRNEICGRCASKIRAGELEPQGGVKVNPSCIVERCERPRISLKSSYCRPHYSRVYRSGTVEGLREKASNGSFQREKCDEGVCEKRVYSKGLCERHYRRRHKEVLGKECNTEGCSSWTPRLVSFCGTHQIQFDRFGETWVGERPHRGCHIQGCEREVGPLREFPECRSHCTDRGKKRLNFYEYQVLMKIDICQICGESEKKVVTDHDHGCCPDPSGKSSKMCKGCIRGRICLACNSALGQVGDSVTILERMIRYLENPPMVFPKE